MKAINMGTVAAMMMAGSNLAGGLPVYFREKRKVPKHIQDMLIEKAMVKRLDKQAKRLCRGEYNAI